MSRRRQERWVEGPYAAHFRVEQRKKCAIVRGMGGCSLFVFFPLPWLFCF